MAITKFEILDKAVNAGGVNLTGKALAGNGAGPKALREDLCRAGHMVKNEAKFSLTPDGKAAWKKEASAERVAQVERLEKQQAAKQLVAFVALVQRKGGKKFTAPQLASFSEATRNEAIKAGYVSATEKAATFELLSEGEAYLLADKPLDEQLAGLRKSANTLITNLNAAQQRMRAEIGQLGEGSGSLVAVATELQQNAGDAGDKFRKVVGELSAFGRLVEAANQFKAATHDRVSDATRQLETGTARLTAMKKEIEKLAEEQRTRLTEAEERIGKRLGEFTAERTVAPVVVVPPSPAVPSVMVTAVAEEIVSFVNDMAKERTVGCDFVELFDHLRLKHTTLTIGTFHDALRALDEAGRIRLKDWPRMQDDIPRPELALFVSHTVMYHVQPAH